MTRKRIIISVAALLLVGAPLLLRALVSPNDFKPLIVKATKSALGLDLRIEGDLSLSLFPRLAVTAGKATLANPPGFPGDLASFKSLRIEADLGKLLEKRLDVNTLILDSPSVTVIRDASGKTNLDALTAPAPEGAPAAAASPQAKPAPPAGQPAGPEQGAPLAISVQALRVTDAALTFDDRQANKRIEIKNASLETGALRPGQPVAVKTGLDFDATNPAQAGHLDLAVKIALSPDGAKTALDDLTASLRVAGQGLPKDGLELRLAGKAAFDTQSSKASLDATLSGPDKASIAVKTDLTLAPAGPTGQAAVVLKDVSPRALAAKFGTTLPDTRDPAAFSRFEGELRASLSPDKIELRSDKLNLDKSTITLALTAPGGDPGKGPFKGSIRLDSLDIDAYAPRPETRPQGPPPGGPPPVASFAGLPDTNLELAVDKLAVAGAKLAGVAATVTVRGGEIAVAPVTLALYGGKVRADAKAGFVNGLLKLALNCEGSNIAVEPLLRDTTGQAKITGTAQFAASVTANGPGPAETLATLAGKAGFNLRHGVINGVSITPELLRSPQSLLGEVNKEHSQGSTRYDSISGSFTISRGVAHTNDFAVAAPQISAAAQGAVDLPHKTLDMKVTARALGLPPVPGKLTGPLEHPSFALDAAGIVTGVIEAPAAIAGAIAKPAAKPGQTVVDTIGGLFAPKK